MASIQVKSSKGEYIIHGFVFVDEQKNMYGVREVSSREGRVWYGLASVKDTATLRQFGLSVENISHAEVAQRIEAQRASQLKRELNRMTRLQEALDVATESFNSTNFGNKNDVEFKIKKCREKINALSN